MKNAKRMNPELGSYVMRVCAGENCPHPFEQFLSLSGLEKLCPECRRKLKCAELEYERGKRINAWKRMGAGMRLLFGGGAVFLPPGGSAGKREVQSARS